jgi:hypothetical protein
MLILKFLKENRPKFSHQWVVEELVSQLLVIVLENVFENGYPHFAKSLHQRQPLAIGLALNDGLGEEECRYYPDVLL